jgi:tetratricopeptide (TPR) repeat protein
MELYLTQRKRADFPDNMELSPGDMPINLAIKALELAAASKSPMVVLKGNEPAIYPELDSLLAACGKRNLGIFIETGGLMPDGAKTLLQKSAVNLLWRLYRPELYSPADLLEMRTNLQDFMAAQLPLQFIGIADDPSANYDFIIALMEEFGVKKSIMRVDCRTALDELRPLASWCASQAGQLLQKGMTLSIDCGMPACVFSDEDYGRLAKMGMTYGQCVPYQGVLPDGRVCHCRHMRQWPGPQLGTFKSENQLQQYYFDIFRELQWHLKPFPGCHQCPSLVTSQCVGVSMATKATRVQQDYQQLKNELEQEAENVPAEEHYRRLWQMTEAAMLLALYADAIECLEELRRLEPANGNVHYLLGCAYWENAQLGEGEEEFRKAARLMENPLLPLGELHRRLYENGNLIKARILQEEIRRTKQSMDEKKNDP